MAYTTVDDVKAYYNGLETTDTEGNDTNVTEADIQQFIDEQTVVIDLKIGKKYELPITDSDDLTYLKIVNDKLAVCIIDKIMRAYAMDDESEFVRKRNYCKEGNEMIKEILDGTVPLNTTQKSYVGFRYNKTTVYDDDCDCRQNEVDCSDD